MQIRNLLPNRGFKIQAPIYLKIMALVLIVLVATVSAIVWKTQSLIMNDKIAFMSDAAARQVAPLKRLVQTELDQEKSRLVEFASLRTVSGVGKARQFGDFDVIALMQPTAGGEQGAQQWTPSWIEKGPRAGAENWAAGHELTLLKSMPFAKVHDGEMTWVRVSDSRGTPVYALLVAVEVQQSAAAQAPQAQAQAPALPDAPAGAPAAAPQAAAPAPSQPGKAIVVGFMSTDPLAGATEDSIGSLSTVFVVDDRGYVAAHTNRAYLGSLFSSDPLVLEIMKGRKISATGQFEDLEHQPILGHFERVDHTNLYAVATTPMGAALALLDAHMKTALLAGLGVGLVGLMLAWAVGRGISRPLSGVIEAIRALGRGAADARIPAVNSGDEVGELSRLLAETSPTAFALRPELVAAVQQQQKSARGSSDDAETPRPFSTEESASDVSRFIEASPERLAEERRAAFEAFSEGLGKAVREPLLAILAQAKLIHAKAKDKDEELVTHAESIEDEARHARLVVERLQGFGLEEGEFSEADRMDLEDVVRSVLERMRPDFALAEVHVSREIGKVPELNGSEKQIEEALIQILENALEAMKKSPVKSLKVQLEYLGDHVYLTVSDTGVGMSPEVKAHAFEPFYKEFSGDKHQGLGLSYVYGAMKRHGGACAVDTAPGMGTSVTLKFSVSNEEKKAFVSQPLVVPPPRSETASAPAQVPTPAPMLEMVDIGEDDEENEPSLVAAAEPLFGRPESVEKFEFKNEMQSGLSFDDEEDEDEPELFANVSIGHMLGNNVKLANNMKQEPAQAKETPAPAAKADGEFKVNIRRPRPRV